MVQAPRLVIDDQFKHGTTVTYRQEFVDLLLILHHGKTGFSMLQDILHLISSRILV